MPTLYIGLGGTGLETLKRLKKRFDHEGIKDEKEVQYIGVDIGGKDINAREGINEVSIVFREGSVESIIGDDHYYGQVSHWWFDETDKPSLSFDDQGAYQERKYGRLALFRNGNENRSPLIERIKRAINAFPKETGIRFVILASVSGGTGAGMFAEMPGIIKELRKGASRADSDKIYGFLILHDVVKHLYGIDSQKEKEDVAKNGISLLAELDLIQLYYQTQPITFNINNLEFEKERKDFVLHPYDFINLTGLVNEKHHKMDEKDDYIALQSFGAWLFHNLTGSAQAIENITKGPITAPFAKTKFTISSKSGQRSEYEIPALFPRKYMSFGVVVLDIEEEKIKNYLLRRIANLIWDEFSMLSDKQNQEIKVNKDKLDSLLFSCKESEGSNNLTNHAYGIIADIAKSTRQNFLIKAHKNVLRENVATNIMGAADVFSLINEYKRGIEVVFNHDDFIKTYVAKLEDIYKNTYKNILGVSGIGNRDITLLGKIKILETLIRKTATEKKYIEEKKIPWLNSRSIDLIDDRIKKSIEVFANYKPGMFSFNKKKVAAAKKAYADDIAKELILEYFEFQLLLRIAQPIKSFFDKLIDQLTETLTLLKNDSGDISRYCNNQPEFVESIQPSTGGKTLIDFHIKLANTRTILDKYALKDNFLNSYISANEIIGISNLNQIEIIARKISEDVLENHITIDNMLQWEAMYFLNDWPISIEQDAKRIVHFTGLIDFYRKATPNGFEVFFNGIAKDFFDINIIKSEDFVNYIIGEIDERNIIIITETIIKARLKCILDHLYVPFISKSGRKQRFYDNKGGRVLADNYKTTLLMHKDNKILEKTITSINRFEDRQIKVDSFEGILKTRSTAHIMVFEVGFPLIESESLCELGEDESSRLTSNLKYFNGETHANTHHNDKRYATNPKYLSYSPFLWLNKGQNHVVNPWKLFLLLMAQDYIESESNASPVLIKKSIGSETNTLLRNYITVGEERKEVVFDDANTLYMLLLNCSDLTIRDLIKHYEKSLKDKEDGKEALMEAFESFREKEYATALNLVMKDYVESLFE